jgi:GNAT superfamily N-acetyltransferase
MRVVQQEQSSELEHVRALFLEYLTWVNEQLLVHHDFSFDVQSKVEEGMETLDQFSPPHGRLLLVREGDAVAGLGCLRQVAAAVGEIKRMYLRPAFRGRGLGRTVLNQLVSAAEGIGHTVVRLDSPSFSTSAHTLYQSCGFQLIEPYSESEVPTELHKYWVFMERRLGSL